MLTALCAGQTDPWQLAALRDGPLAASRVTPAVALHDNVTAHHRFLLSQHLRMIEYLEQAVRDFEGQVEVVVAPFRAAVACLVTIPGISATAAHVIIAEIGVDIDQKIRPQCLCA